MRALLLAILLYLTSYLPSHAQLPAHNSVAAFDLGMELFQKQKYEVAQHQLEAYIREQKDDLNTILAHYYAALCAIKLGQPDGEQRFHQFIKTYPKHPKAVFAYYQLGNFYFSNQDFAKSIIYYLQVDKGKLDQATQYALQYHLAYAYLSEKNFAQALACFNDIKAHENAYYYAANYYAGYIAFRNGNYATALTDLERASQSASYQAVVPYLVLQVYYKQKRFQELLNYIQEIKSADVVLKNEDEIALLTAEGYFFTKKYAAAAQHYEEYIALKDFVATSEVLYRTAYALYQAGEAYKAFQYFKDLAIQQDAIGQAASYYAGLLYLKKKQKMAALTAFDKARRARFFADIQEEAAFQYAKLSYEVGHFTNTIEALQNFRRKYSSHQRVAEADALLSKAYLHTNDYDLAITHIEHLANQSQDLLKVYQKVTFYKGSEHFNNAAYDQAISLFRKSLKHPLDPQVSLQAQLWLGESFSALQQYDKAQAAYQQVLNKGAKTTTTYHQALYGLGYAYFNTTQYAQALPQFVQYTRQSSRQAPKRWLRDAWVRTADCYYAIKAYEKALKVYKKALRYDPAHVHYQQGVIYGLLGDQAAAHASFQVIFKQHTDTLYYEKALFELGHIALVKNDYTQAIRTLTKLIKKKPNSSLIPDTLLHRAIANVNLKKYTQAIRDYEQLLKAYPQHPNVQNSLLELSKIYKLAGKPQAFDRYLAAYKAANSDHVVLEQLAFDTAKGHFYDQNYGAAVKKLRKFLEQYPKSKWTPEARFLVAEAYYRQGNAEKALKSYRVASQGQHMPFYNKILLRMGALSYQKKDFEQALQYYQTLKQRAKTQRETYYALEGAMKANHALQRYEAVQKTATLIIKQGNLAANATHEATLFLGKAAMQQGKYQEARDYFKQLVKNSTDIHAAEAQYLLAQLHYEAQEYHQSLTTLFDLNKQFPAYKTWTNQGFLLIADNYVALKEVFQAKATLQSIIDNAEDKSIVATARKKLATLAQLSEGTVKLDNTDQEQRLEHEFKTLED